MRKLAVTLVAVAALGTCGAGLGTGAAASARAAKVVPITSFHAVFVDDTRPSPASSTKPAETTRTLDTTITLPVKKSKKPLPLVVLAHGLSGNPGKFSQLMGAWAETGYVVAAPLFPRSSDLTGLPPLAGDVVNQPADVSFVIDQVLRLNRDKESKLYKRIDPRKIGLAGLSLGGWTTYGTVFHTCCHDERIKATVIMAAVFGSFDGGTYDFTANVVPALLLHGTNDPLYSQSVTAYPQLSSPKYFVTLNGSSHPGPFEDLVDPNDAVATAATLAFWDRYLKGEKAATARLVGAVEGSGGSATIQQEP